MIRLAQHPDGYIEEAETEEDISSSQAGSLPNSMLRHFTLGN
jgi:hypothetical protein